MYQRPEPKHHATILQMGSGRKAEFRPQDRRLFVGGVAHGDVKESSQPVVTMKALRAPIDYLKAAEAGGMELQVDAYQAQRITFGGMVFRTWMLQGAEPAQHAIDAVLALIHADPARVRQVVEHDPLLTS